MNYLTPWRLTLALFTAVALTVAGVGADHLRAAGPEGAAAPLADGQPPPGKAGKGSAQDCKEEKDDEQRKFDEVRWREAAKGGLPELHLVLTKPNTTHDQRDEILTKYAKAALRESERHKGKKVNVVFLVRDKAGADEGLVSGFGLEGLRELSRAEPEQARWLATWHGWCERSAFRVRLKDCAEARKEAEGKEGKEKEPKFDLVRWRQGGKGLPASLFLALTKPNTTGGERAAMLARHAKAALREAERHKADKFGVVFLIRETAEADKGLVSGLGFEELRETSWAEPEQACWLAAWHLWGGGGPGAQIPPSPPSGKADKDLPQDGSKHLFPTEEYEALVDALRRAQEAFNRAYQTATTDAEKQQVLKELGASAAPQYHAEGFLKLMQKHPKDSAALKCFRWLLTFDPAGRATVRGADIIAAHHADGEEMAAFCPSITSAPFPVAEPLLRTVLKKNQRHRVQGQARFALARCLTIRADSLVQASATKERERLGGEAEKLFQEVVKDYGDLKGPPATLGKSAEAQLFALRHLFLGKVAPEIEGEDVDGKALKLSDYRGKVVLLVFWGTW